MERAIIPGIAEISTSFDLLYFVSVSFLILIFLKFIQIIQQCSQKRLQQERIERKYLFAHRKVVKDFLNKQNKHEHVPQGLNDSQKSIKSTSEDSRAIKQKFVKQTINFKLGKDESSGDQDSLCERDSHQSMAIFISQSEGQKLSSSLEFEQFSNENQKCSNFVRVNKSEILEREDEQLMLVRAS